MESLSFQLEAAEKKFRQLEAVRSRTPLEGGAKWAEALEASVRDET